MIEVLMHYQVCKDVCISKEKKFAFSLGECSAAQETGLNWMLWKPLNGTGKKKKSWRWTSYNGWMMS